MSWQIHCIENTVKISKKTAGGIYDVQRYEGSGEGEFFCKPDDVRDKDGHLKFNSDHDEHQDYLSTSDEIVEVLRKAKAKGRVAFLDVEQGSTPTGDLWAHEFDGKGGYVRLIGKNTIVWTPEPKL